MITHCGRFNGGSLDSIHEVLTSKFESSSNNTTMYGFQMQTGGARTSMNASANGEVDLELRLG